MTQTERRKYLIDELIKENTEYKQLTSLNVQGCSALKELECWSNKLNADAFTKIFNDLPARDASDGARCTLYTEETGGEGNCMNFNTPATLKAAFDGAKGRNWKMFKEDESGSLEEI